jgi:hypothetical protein
VRNCRQVGDGRRGAGRSPAAARIRRIVPSPMRWPRPRSSPWMRRYPQRGFCRANCRTSSRTSSGIEGRPAVFGWVHLFLIRRRCQASRVPGVTIRCRRRRAGSSRARAAITARSAQSGFGRSTWRRRTATSCRSTRISASFELSLRARSANQPNSLTMRRYVRRITTSAERRTPGQSLARVLAPKTA